jgi:hypothetical protein
MHLSMLRKGGGGMAYVGHLIDFCFPTLGEFGRNHLPKVGPRIFELSAILHPEEEHMRTFKPFTTNMCGCNVVGSISGQTAKGLPE